ncbi:phosphotransferase [Deinococcus ruber]|nr:phosphotransferase [Deinococcus ruber]
MSERFLADAVLLNSGGREVARLERLEISQESAQALTQAVEQRWGQAVWLLHDGGLELGRRGTAARFEVQGKGGAVLPGVPNDRPWQRPGWRAQIGAWLETELNESPQRLTVIHASDIGCVLSMETGQGRRYFKAGEDGREVRAALEAARLFPTLTPEILAADEQRGWLLTRDAGVCLLTSVRLDDWRGGVARLTQVQQGASFAGVPIHRFAELPARAEALLLDTAALTHWGLNTEQLRFVQALLSPFWAAYEHVAALGLPDTPAHGDFHPNNVLIDAEGVVRLFDWSEGCTQHPLLDLGWLLAFVQHPARAEHPVRMALPELAQTLWRDWLSAWKLTTALRWQDAALVALIHRAVVYDARYRSWTGSVPGFRPQFTPYYLNMARHFA